MFDLFWSDSFYYTHHQTKQRIVYKCVGNKQCSAILPGLHSNRRTLTLDKHYSHLLPPSERLATVCGNSWFMSPNQRLSVNYSEARVPLKADAEEEEELHGINRLGNFFISIYYLKYTKEWRIRVYFLTYTVK